MKVWVRGAALVCAAAAAVSAAGCRAKEVRCGYSSVEDERAQLITNQAAMADLARTRCDRAEACTSGGAGAAFDRSACEKLATRATRSVLRQDNCPRGVRRAFLQQCASDTRGESCDRILDTARPLAVASCQDFRLCAQPCDGCPTPDEADGGTT